MPAQPMAMGDDVQLGLLRDSWLAYLSRQRHRTLDAPESIVMIRSLNGGRRRYRWLLMTCEGPTRILSRQERGRMREEMAKTARSREKPYLVVGFVGEPRHIVVIPASSALSQGAVRSDRGGIAWED